jgi:hypothetical protein
MTSFRTIVSSILGLGFFASPFCAQDFSKYREFHLGTSLPVVAKQDPRTPGVDSRVGMASSLP